MIKRNKIRGVCPISPTNCTDTAVLNAATAVLTAYTHALIPYTAAQNADGSITALLTQKLVIGAKCNLISG